MNVLSWSLSAQEIEEAAPAPDGQEDLRIFSVLVKVTDPEALFQSAMNKLAREGIEEDDALSALKLPDGRINVNKCLVYLLDGGYSPDGIEIMDSSAQREKQ